MYDATIVIVSYNTRDLLDRSIASVYDGSPEIEKEVIVVENASVDGSREMLAAKWPDVKVLANDTNRGYAPACNQGLRQASARYVLALNSDAFLIGDALAKLVRFMDDNPDVCAVVPKLLNVDGSLQYMVARRQPTVFDQFVFYSNIDVIFPGLAWRRLSLLPKTRYESTNDVDVLSGACTLFRPSALTSVGLLDERLVINYDDIEWCVRARKMGCRLVYYPEAEATHLGSGSRDFNPDTAIRNLRTAFAFFGIAYSWPSAMFLKLTVLGATAITVVKDAVLSVFRPSRRKILRQRASMLGRLVGIVFGK
jgi:N-acetylglucosaminyl-diphospho-decaprenol L-rhamnosyltransferase